MLATLHDFPAPGYAGIDRVRIVIQLGSLEYSDDEQLDEFCHDLCRPPNWRTGFSEWRHLTAFGDDPQYARYGWIFNSVRYPHGGRGRRELEVRKRRSNSDLPSPGLPLWTGKLFVTPVSGARQAAPNRALIKADLFLNPTRFAFHQHPETIVTTARVPRVYWEESSRYESSLTLDDNVLLGRHLRLNRSEHSRNQSLTLYWQTVVSCIRSELERSSAINGLAFTFSPNFNLRIAEIYWEVENEDSFAEMARIRPKLVGIGRSISTDLYATEGRTEASPSIKIRLAKGVQLKVYAKTQFRIRYEIAYNIGAAALGTRHTSEYPEAIPDYLNSLKGDASERLVPIFRRLRLRRRSRPLYNILRATLATTLGPDEAARVLLQLFTNGSFNKRTFGSRGAAIERRLKHQRILESNPVSGGPAILHPDYAASLRSLCNFSPTL